MIICAELGASHNGTLERALETVRAAARCGADAVKLQTWTPDTMDCGGRWIESGPWKGHNLRDLYRKAHTPWDWHRPIADLAGELGMEWWSTPFDHASVDYLESLNCPRYKIASFEIVDLDLIVHASNTLRPMIISTGMATEAEITDAVALVNPERLTLLRCVSGYPADPIDYNLHSIPDMRRRFGCEVGLSDHTKGVTLPVVATALGATMIERHLTISRADGLDDSFASTPDQFLHMVASVRTAQEALGGIRYGVVPSELPQHALRRSLWVCEDVKAGDIVSRQNVRSARPADGISPGHLPFALGQVFRVDVAAGTPLKLEHL